MTSPPVPPPSAEEIIRLLGLRPHPEGGWFVESWRDPPGPCGERGASTAIYYLLQEGERSHWHRVDATEVWHWYGGAPLRLRRADAAGVVEELLLGPDLRRGARPQLVIPPGVWQAAGPARGGYTLVGCTVAPAFAEAGFTLAPPGWEPGPPG
ncbi:MAG: cupin domain-containing protein [Myxococcota bacterium]|jgi:predicted cupin superfamily sugar epimerase|nr:cupin domain-containing protein [Myxococcota bacterium]